MINISAPRMKYSVSHTTSTLMWYVMSLFSLKCRRDENLACVICAKMKTTQCRFCVSHSHNSHLTGLLFIISFLYGVIEFEKLRYAAL